MADGVLYVPEVMIPSLDVKPGQVVKVGLGNMRRCARVQVSKQKGRRVSFSEELALKLRIPKNTVLNAVREEEALRLGPLVGIMAYSFNPRRLSFGEQDGYFRRLLACTASEGAVGYIFTPSSVDWISQRIYGYYLAENYKKWKKGIFTFPDVCYDRYFHPDRDDSGTGKIREGFKKRGVKWFNSPIGNKWIVYQMMKKIPAFHDVLPATFLFQQKRDLEAILKDYPTVYVKPMIGSRGSEVFRISRLSRGYSLQGAEDKAPLKLEKLQEVMDTLSPHLKAGRFLLQEAIEGPKGISHFDIRVMVQKEGGEEWKVSGMVARMALKGGIVSNLHKGGTAVPIQKVLTACDFPPQAKSSIQEHLGTLALKIAQSLDQGKEHLGELGLDFLLDNAGKVWFLEANIKPGRRAFRVLGDNFSQILILRPVRYAKFLAGFNSDEGVMICPAGYG